MTDRELLELAAKAAGLRIVVECPVTDDGWLNIYNESGRGMRTWNPLTDDGDALRLAVKLRMDIAHFSESVRADITGYDDFHVSNDGDPYAATRRAIVRAAAEIGRTK